MKSTSPLLATAFVLLSASQAQAAELPAQQPEPELGQVTFTVACNEAAQDKFNTAVAYFHSFQWAHVKPATDEVLKADPSCGMAHWLHAFSMLDNPFAWPGGITTAAMSNAPMALEAARSTGLKTERERDYVDALEIFFQDKDTLDHRTRAKKLEEAFEQVAKQYPDDPEASIFYALVLSSNFDPSDDQFVNQLKAAEILEPIFDRYPRHPGVAHYLIHSYDYPEIADKGIEAAKIYAEIAPAAPHAYHMPSHIFTHVGMWQESIATNRAAADTANDSVTHDGHHAFDYMVYAQLQLGDVEAARKVMEEQGARYGMDFLGVAYPHSAIPARIALEQDDWREAANLELNPSAEDFPWAKYPQAEAVNA